MPDTKSSQGWLFLAQYSISMSTEKAIFWRFQGGIEIKQ